MSSNRPKRKRETPEQATEARKRVRAAEAAARERRREADRAIAAQVQQARIDAAPVTAADRSDLDDVAYNLHYAYNWDGHGDECVTAVVHLRDGTYRVFAQRFMSAMEDYAGRHYAAMHLHFSPGGGSHLHAEMYAIWYYLARGLTPSEVIAEIGVSKEICPLCQHVLNYLGITYNLRWVTSDKSKNWINPWDILESSCKPAVKDWRKHDSDEDEDEGGGGKGMGGGGGKGVGVERMVGRVGVVH